jgi:peptidoglycan/xylan/chitin deacetylase (PgdA/CDA1 family)
VTVYAYSRIPAFNPNTNPASVAKSATGSVYDIGDTGFTTPLNLTLVATNTVTTTLISDANAMFPDFTLADRTQCAFKSGTQVFVLTTTTPIPGPASTVAGPEGPAGPATTDASLMTAGTLADARLPTRLQDTALNATFVPKWKATTAYLVGDKVLSPGGDVVSAIANHTSGASFTAANWNFSPTYASQSYVTPRRIPRPQPKKTATVQPGHGWALAGADGSSNLNDTTDFVFGSQSIKVVSDAAAGSADLTKSGLSLDSRAGSLRIWFKVDDMAKLGQIIVYAGTPGLAAYWLWTVANTIPSPDTRWLRSGDWAGITLPWSDATLTGTPDRAAITNLQIRVKGVSGQQATVRVGGVDVVAADQSFAKGVVSLTFDDSKDSQYLVARPIMDNYGFPGTAFTIPEAWGGTSYMTLAQHKELEDKHGWEISAHSMSVADHNTSFVGQAADYLDSRLAQMRAFLKVNGFRGSDVGAYPGGQFSPTVIDTVKKYQSASRLAYSTTDFRSETLPPADPMRIRCVQLNNGVAPATITAAIDRAIANKEWLVILTHGIATTGDAYNYPTADFTTVVDYINSSGIACRIMSDVLGAMTSTTPAIPASGGVDLSVGLSDVAATIADSRFGYTLPETGADTGVYYQPVNFPLDAFTGTAVGFDITWASPVAITGNVRWLGRLSVLSPSGTVLSTASVDVAITPTVPGVANTTITSRVNFPTVMADGTAKRLELHLTRTATHGLDTSIGDVRLLGTKLIYSKA